MTGPFKALSVIGYVALMALFLALALRLLGGGRNECREALSAAFCQSAFLGLASIMMFFWGYALVRGVQAIRSR